MATNSYVPTHWEDADSTATPLNAANLNHVEVGIKAVTDAVIAMHNAGISPENIAATIVNAAKLPNGSSNELVKADSSGKLNRSGAFVSNDQTKIIDSSSVEKYVPTARAIAKKLSNIEDGVAAATEAVQALEETMPEEAEDLSFGVEDDGYVTPDMVYQIINDVLWGGNLRIVNNRLKFTDLYDDTVYDLGGVTA